jgi:decaprenylphospho-beta-D-erythro-pentofuranosid-2-ulose 2-reductase
VVLGASWAFARGFARAAARDGADILLAGRDDVDMEATAADLRARFGRRAEIANFDLRIGESHTQLMQRAVAFAADKPLSLFFAVGVMPGQDILNAHPEQARDVIDTNFTAAVQLLQVAALHYETRRAGRIVVLGSVAGDRGRLGNYVYGSAKAGLHAYLQGLRARLFRSGVPVTTVKPGPVDTAMTFGLKKLPLIVPPETVAEISLKAAMRGTEEVYAPAPWRLIMAILRAIPERIFKKLNI